MSRADWSDKSEWYCRMVRCCQINLVHLFSVTRHVLWRDWKELSRIFIMWVGTAGKVIKVRGRESRSNTTLWCRGSSCRSRQRPNKFFVNDDTVLSMSFIQKQLPRKIHFTVRDEITVTRSLRTNNTYNTALNIDINYVQKNNTCLWNSLPYKPANLQCETIDKTQIANYFLPLSPFLPPQSGTSVSAKGVRERL